MTRVKHVSRYKYNGFVEKAEQYYNGMKSEFEGERPNNSVTMAVHCAISWTDAFTVYKLGRKSSAQSHGEAVGLLKEAKSSDEKKKSQIMDSLLELIDMKTPAEYEDGILGNKDAKRAINLCEKIRAFFINEFEKTKVS
ncbi:HEPN domain-containing protein [Candidatus Micrarchaeota archaeon]|nr:HEPN domain-containing protein [Candidatus Micrarchaeota archaeon]